jgi:hypothetical protein
MGQGPRHYRVAGSKALIPVVALQLRLPQDLHDALRQLAVQEGRSLNQTMLRCLRDGCLQRGIAVESVGPQ